MKIRCLVLDDEELAIELLLSYIAKVPFLEVTGSFTDPSEALTFLETHTVDLIFLDVEMPNHAVDGIDFINLATGKQGYIFTTAYPEYALKSYEYNAIDFLHKPISFERFSRAVQKAKALVGTTGEEVYNDEFTYLRVEGRFHRLEFDDVCWVTSERNYVSIYTEQDRINLKINIGDLEAQLPRKLFVRVHKSYIVSWKKLDLVEPHQLWVRRQEQVKPIPLGDAYRKTVMDMIGQIALRKR